MNKAKMNNVKMHLPVDVVTASKFAENAEVCELVCVFLYVQVADNAYVRVIIKVDFMTEGWICNNCIRYS